MSFLTNPDLQKYVIQWEGMSFKKGLNVQDINHNQLGEIKDESKIISKILSLYDNKKSPIVKIRQKKRGFSESMDILDSNQKVLGIAEDKELNAFIESSGEIMRLVDPAGKELLTSSGIFLSPYETPKEIRTFFINEIKGKTICNIHCKIEEEPIKGIINWLKPVPYKNTCTFEILKPDFDRKLLWGFFLSIIAMVYGKEKVSD